MQMPGMYLRGSLCNVTMKELNEEQQLAVSSIVDEIKDDPALQAARVEFRNALKYTIKGDYLNTDAADQEYQISLWRAVVAAKYGWGKHEPSEEAISDKKQRKKFFQTWVFNYLRQILNENKRPTIKTTQYVFKHKIDIVKDTVNDLIGKLGTIIKEDLGKEYIIKADLLLCSSYVINGLHNLRNMYFNNGILVDIFDDSIKIHKNTDESENEMVKVETPTLVTTSSIHSNENDESSNSKDIEAIDSAGFEDPDTIGCLYDMLSDTAKKVLILITNPPDDYIEQYGEKPVKKYISAYLNLTNRQIKDVWSELKLSYTAVIGFPD